MNGYEAGPLEQFRNKRRLFKRSFGGLEVGSGSLRFYGDGGGAKRELDFEGAALAWLARDFAAAAVFFHDAADEGEAEAGALAAGRVEGAGDLRLLLFFHVAARVRE